MVYTEEHINELIKCNKDPLHFIENYIQIMHPTKGNIDIELYDSQRDLISTYNNNNYVIANTSRQVGNTIILASYILWFALFKCDQTILLISNKLENAKQTLDYIRKMYNALPEWIKPSIESMDGKTEIEFDNKSRIMVRAASPNAMKGRSLSMLVIDNMAYIPPETQTAIWEWALPCLYSNGKLIVSSTPNKPNDLFHKLFLMAQDEESFLVSRTIPWNAVPNRDENWKVSMIGMMGEKQWKTEYECEWVEEDVS
jgi:hypothetical protein